MLAQQRARGAGEEDRSAVASAQRISDWMNGRNVPGRFESLWPVLQVLIAKAKHRAGTSREAVNLRAWRELWAAARNAPSNRSEPAARQLYPEGPLTEEDEDIFFGRRRALASLLDMVRMSTTPNRLANVMVLAGASGVGKTSLLQAGLVPALTTQAEPWAAAIMIPGTDPVHAMTQIFGSAGGSAGDTDCFVDTDTLCDVVHRWCRGRRMLLIVDQFEELFGDSLPQPTRELFLTLLQRLSLLGSILISVRSDHITECAQHPWLAHALRHNSFTLNPMSRNELVSAISGPPRTQEVTVEAGVIELLISSVHEYPYRIDRSHGDSGSLSILSAAMRSLWSAHVGNKLDITAYRRVGGVHTVVRRMAEKTWANLTAAQQLDARQILLALVTVHRDGSIVRRRLPCSELRRVAVQLAGGMDLVNRLVRGRLITVDQKCAYLIHDAVLDWDQLKSWITENRSALAWRQRIEADAAEWAAADRDPDMLYRGIRLSTAVRNSDPAMSVIGTDFLRASARVELDAQAVKHLEGQDNSHD
ncbi:ATP-binding protein [Nocardia transvalensis]|uniref:nSTAND1 domain-containing NTPase n=1 Tax=Nocardia transvalensis TaxID=37333 RepID=UPI0018962373|nr:ATP-binding protein [Nocardia transvalensis]MBF6332442.1 ATP-binding protein [Nocardia transvalensis]